MGPDFRSMNEFLAGLSDAVTVDLDSLTEMSSGVYWLALNVVLGLVFMWVVCSIIVLTKIDLRCKGTCAICYYIGVASEFILPLMGNAAFLPITSILLDVFVCDEAYSEDGDPDWTDSFLYRDCEENCWTDDHKMYVSVALVGMFAYIPSAVFARPLW